MGTNYYYHTDICEHCKRSNKIHVGKKSFGWAFHFRAHRVADDVSIISVSDWERFFKTTPGILADEYDRVVEDPLKWLAELDRPTKQQQEDEDSPTRRGSWSPHPDPRTEWRDSEGFAFYDGEFQ